MQTPLISSIAALVGLVAVAALSTSSVPWVQSQELQPHLLARSAITYTAEIDAVRFAELRLGWSVKSTTAMCDATPDKPQSCRITTLAKGREHVAFIRYWESPRYAHGGLIDGIELDRFKDLTSLRTINFLRAAWQLDALPRGRSTAHGECIRYGIWFACDFTFSGWYVPWAKSRVVGTVDPHGRGRVRALPAPDQLSSAGVA